MYSGSLFLMIRCPYLRHKSTLIKIIRGSSTTVKPTVAAKNANDVDIKLSDSVENNDVEKTFVIERGKNIKSNLVAAAFAPVKSKYYKKYDSVDEAILKASSAEQLLSLVDTCKLNRKQALKIISILADWAASGETDMKDFEHDSRFTSLCQMLGRPYSPASQKPVKPVADDLTMVLNVKNDDEAAKIITTFTIQQMVKVMSSLAFKRRRSVPLLRSISFSMAQHSTKLDVKQGADVLYALASLNYMDEVLLEKVCSELYECIPKCKKASVIGSISTSLGILKYKDNDLLDCLCEWTSKNLDLSRIQDFNSLLITMAHVNHLPSTSEEFFKHARQRLLTNDHSSNRIEIVWALAVLDQANKDDLISVLNPEYYSKIKSTYPDGLPTSIRKKLLNINGLAKLSGDYNGPFLEDSEELEVISTRSKDKQILLTSVFEALSNLLPSTAYLRTNIDLKMGFNLDGECLIDSKMTPIPVLDRKTGEPLQNTKKGIKIGIFVWDYHEHTKGRVNLCGVPTLSQKLATASGYRVLSIPYFDFNPKNKLTDRIRYLEKNLKLLVKH